MLLMLGIVLLASGLTGATQRESAVVDSMFESSTSTERHVAVLVTEGFQDAEAYMPIGYLANRGVNITVIGPDTGRVKAYNSDFEIVIDKAVSDVTPDDFDALIIPGGKAPAKLKEDPASVEFAKNFFNTGKLVAAICHGPQVLAAAGVLKGVTTTGVNSIQGELEAAGAKYLDQALVTDKNLITSRVPDDLPVFAEAIDKALNSAR
ncbi:MAG TPA: protease [Porphyromonadaceae bacterium]|nr:protease [Porphyromonadaceae bacterium]